YTTLFRSPRRRHRNRVHRPGVTAIPQRPRPGCRLVTRTTRTGHTAWESTPCEVEARMVEAKPPRPREPMTMRPAGEGAGAGNAVAGARTGGERTSGQGE